jgi:hypothetical protein
MIFRRPRLAFSSAALCGAVGLSVYSSAALADVFEMGNGGAWQQVSQRPYDPTEFEDSDGNADGEKLPPVRLVAIAGAVQSADASQNLAFNPSLAQGEYAPVINAAAQQYGISPALVDAVMWQEYRYKRRCDWLDAAHARHSAQPWRQSA